MIAGLAPDLVEAQQISVIPEKQAGFREMIFFAAEFAYFESKINK